VSSSLVAESTSADEGFHHQAFFYAGENEFVAGASAFVVEAVAAREPVLVVVSARKIDLLRQRLGSATDEVVFADMEAVGTNPARIIPAWTQFVSGFGDRRLRGIGEPIWAERSAAELAECQRHEALLNVAFADSAGFTLMCPYDTESLTAEVMDEARRNHPYLRDDGREWASDEYPGTDAFLGPFSAPLPEPPSVSAEVGFGARSLGGLRSLVRDRAVAAGFGEERASDAAAAVNEVASNSVRHGGGQGVLRIWADADTLICEVSDDGRIDEPLVGRTRPPIDARGGRGLWMVNHLCELVQVRSLATGTTVRMHIRRLPPR
jgi:anti-sigma regulatory factor (Ser/Thr protein kinase)